MDWSAECAALIPCLNEEAAIGLLIQSVHRYLPSVLVVDDGSIDRTAAVARENGAVALRNETNQGKGAALETGWQWAKAQGYNWVLSLDGDGQHSPGDIPRFLRCAEQTSALLVVGNRMDGGTAAMPWVRRRVNRWMSRQISHAAGQMLPDSQCGFRLMNLDAWSALPIRAARFEIESEVLLAFVLAGFTVQFVPIQVIYKNEQSKIHPLRDTLRWFRWWKEAQRRFANQIKARQSL